MSPSAPRPTPWPTLGLAVVVAFCYLPSLWNGFVWIDWSEIVAGLKAVPPTDLWASFIDAGPNATYYRPIYILIHSFDRLVWGLNPLGFHLSSVLLHAANVALLVTLLRRWGWSQISALVIGGLWGLHPVNSCVAGLIHAKADLAVTGLLLGSLLAFQARAWVTCLALYVAALLTKESAFLLPPLLLLCHLARRAREQPVPRQALWRYVWMSSLAALGAGALRMYAMADSAPAYSTIALADRLLTFTTVYLDYLGILVLPLDLRMADTVTAFSALSGARQTAALVGVAAVLGGQAWLAWRMRPLAKWIVLMNLALLPVAQILPILHFRADRYLYLPSLAFAGLVVDAASLAIAWRPRLATVARSVAVLAALLYVIRIGGRLPDFHNDFVMFEEETARTPDYREGLSMLAHAHERRRDYARARIYYERSLEPLAGRISFLKVGAVAVNHANNLLRLRENQAALEFARAYENTVRSAAARAELRYNRAVAAYNLELYKEAVPLFAEYADTHPTDRGCHWLLGVAASRLGNHALTQKALQHFLSLVPKDPTRTEQAANLLRQANRALGDKDR